MDQTQAFSYRCPRWAELPTLALYMDQTLIVIDEAVRPLIPEGEASATSTMINNYVKIKLISPSQKKKYSREHLAGLIMITLLKRVLSMTELASLLGSLELETDYDRFCAELERRLREAFSNGEECAPTEDDFPPLLGAAVRTLACKLRFESIAAEQCRAADSNC